MAIKKRAKPPKRESVSDQSAFVVRHAGYPFDVLVCVAMSDEAIITKLREYDDCEPTPRDLVHIRDDHSDSLAWTLMLDGRQTIISFKEWVGSITHIGQLAHECLHAVHVLFDRIGMALSDDSEEAYAFAIENLTVRILRQLALPPSKRKDEV